MQSTDLFKDLVPLQEVKQTLVRVDPREFLSLQDLVGLSKLRELDFRENEVRKPHSISFRHNSKDILHFLTLSLCLGRFSGNLGTAFAGDRLVSLTNRDSWVNSFLFLR